LPAEPVAPWAGAPLQPTGDPMRDGIGPAAYVDRADTPDLTAEDQPRIVPMRVAADFAIESLDPDPRGMEVVAADREVAGVVRDLWVDRAEPQIRYLEVEVSTSGGARRVLLPLTMALIDRRRRLVTVRAILAAQFADVPPHKAPDQVTLREEDRIAAYYAGGTLYAEPRRLWPAL